MMKLASVVLPVALLAGGAAAQTTRPAEPTLSALDQQVQASVVRVTVPLEVQARVTVQERPTIRILPQREPAGAAMPVYAERLMPATQPLGLGSDSTTRPSSPPVASRVVLAEFLGLVLDDEGDVLLPLFVNKELVGDRALHVSYGDNQVTTGHLVGSDRQTNLSVVKLDQNVGTPARMAKANPALGSLVLLLSPVRRQARLAMWTGGQDEHAVVVNSAGAVAGFMRYGHMLEPYAFGPVARQLIETGEVKRGRLGVLIRELGPEDPARAQYPETLGNRPAARVDTVFPDSAAEKGGLQPGDLVLSLGGEPINDLAHFAAAISRCSGTTDLKILRDGKELVLKVDIEAQ
jgi:S1-C subfamily serine protease